MNKILLVSNHHVLNDLYKVNFKSFLNCEVHTLISLADLGEKIDFSSFNLIVVMSTIDGEDAALKVQELIKLKKASLPVIVVGHKSDIVPDQNIHVIEANLNIKTIISQAATLLGISAKDMASTDVGSYVSFDIKSLLSLKTTPVNLYIQTKKSKGESEYRQCILKGETLKKKVSDYIKKDVKELFVHADFRLEMTMALSTNIINELNNSDFSIEEKIEIVESTFHLIANEITQNSQAKEQLVELSQGCIGVLDSAKKSSKSLGDLINSLLSNESGYVFKHTVLASFVADHIINNVSWGSDEHIEKVNFILFFHDLFLVPIFEKYPDFKNEEDFVFDNSVDNDTKEAVLSHASDMAEAIKSLPKCPMGADAILLQHHGVTNGYGFTVDYKDDISPLSKVIIVAEAYVEQYLETLNEDASSRESIIFKNLNDRFTRHTYKKMISTLKDLPI